MIIGITGTLAAGKGTVVEHLEKLGFKHYSVRDFLIKEIKKRGLSINRGSMVIVANDLRKNNSPSFIVEQLYKEAKEFGGDVVIESIRTKGEVESLREKDNFYLFSVDAKQDIRYLRAINRGSETDKIDFEKFKEGESLEMTSEDPNKQNLKACIEMSDFKFTNNATINELYKKVNSTINAIKNNSDIKDRHISWDEYFMGVAILSGKRSKDPSTQVGACIVDADNKIVGTGYNGAPRGIKDVDFPWSREGDFLNTKYAYVVHAELNAILNSTRETLKNCTIYVALFPCNECAKAIIQSGIRRVVYLSDKYKDVPAFVASRKILTMAGVEISEMKSKINEINLNLKE